MENSIQDIGRESEIARAKRAKILTPTQEMASRKPPNTVYIDFKYDNLNFTITPHNNELSFNGIPCEPTQLLFRLLHPEEHGVPLQASHHEAWWQAQCAFRHLPIVGPLGDQEFRLRRFLCAEEQQYLTKGTVTEFLGLEQAATRALRRYFFGGEWDDLEPEEKFVRDPMRFLMWGFRDVGAEWKGYDRGGYYEYDEERWENAVVEKAFWFTGVESQAVLANGMESFKKYFCSVDEEDPVLVFTRPLGGRAECANGRWNGKMWNFDMDSAGDNYSGLKWVQYGFKRGFILATSNRAAELKIAEIAHGNEMERIKRLRGLKKVDKQIQMKGT